MGAGVSELFAVQESQDILRGIEFLSPRSENYILSLFAPDRNIIFGLKDDLNLVEKDLQIIEAVGVGHSRST